MKRAYCFIFIFLTIVTFLFVLDTFAQDATPRPIVKLIYFLPNDREAQPDINEKFDTLIKEVQELFANQMEAHGFERKTFLYETGERGKAVVHHVNGRQTDAYYNNLADTFDMWSEIAEKFDTSKDIYLAAIDISSEILNRGKACGLGSGWNAAGQALVPASGDCFDVDTIAHELGHTFGLNHGFYSRDIENKTVVSFSHDRMLNTYWTAHWLDVHAAFNPPRPAIDLDSVQMPTVQMLPLSGTASPNTIRLRFEITGSNGLLHQAQLLRPANSYSRYPDFVAGKLLATTADSIVEFVTVALLPEDRNVYLQLIDTSGVMTRTQYFPIDITPFLQAESDFYETTRALGKGGASDIAYSPDGAHFAVAGDGITLYDAQTQHPVDLLEGAEGGISSIVFSPDGRLIAGGYWKYSYIWDVVTGEILHTRSGKTYVLDLAFSPDEQLLAIAGSDGSIRLWDYGKNIIRHTLIESAVNINSVAFSPDGRTLASGGTDDTVHIWDVRTGDILHTLKEHQHWVKSVAFSPDGQTLASSALEDTIYLWDVVTGEIRDTFNHQGWIFNVAFSPNGKTLASSGSDSIRIWSVRTGEILQELEGHKYGVTSIAFSPGGNTLASLSPQDSNICLWDVDTGVSRHTFNDFTAGGIGMIMFSPDGQTLASKEENVIRLWDVRTNKVRHTLTGVGQRVSFAFSPDSQTIACEVWLDESSIYLWDVDTGEIERGIPVSDNETAGSVAFSPDGQTLAGAIQSKTRSKGSIRLWDVHTGRVQSDSSVEILTGGEVFSPDMQTLASGLWDGRIHLFDVRTGKIRHTLTGHQDSVDDLAFSPDSKILASSGSDTTVRLWDVRTGRLLHTLIGHRSVSNSVAFHPNSQTLASGLSPVYLWDVRTGSHRKTLKVPGLISYLAFSPDGQMLAGASGGKVQFWEASSDLPLPVSLSNFRAEQTLLSGVLLKWTTESEVDNAGFYIYRSRSKDGKFKVINPKLIQGAGTTGERTEYSWTDTTAKPNTVYYYRIEDVSHAGDREQLATVRLRGLVSAKDKQLTKWSDLKHISTF